MGFPPRTMPSRSGTPADAPILSSSTSQLASGVPFTDAMLSPAWTPASAAGFPAVTAAATGIGVGIPELMISPA
jgi:hypothetical protein